MALKVTFLVITGFISTASQSQKLAALMAPISQITSQNQDLEMVGSGKGLDVVRLTEQRDKSIMTEGVELAH